MTGEKQSVRGRRDVPSRTPGSVSGSDDGSFTPLTPEEREFLNAKMYLMTQNETDGPSLYEHMAKLITHILDNKPDHSITLFENMSNFLKRDRIHIPTQAMRDHVPTTYAETLSKAQWNLLKKTHKPVEDKLENNVSDDAEQQRFQGVPNIMRQALFFEMAGVGLPREEFVRISLSLSDLVDKFPYLQSIRFWGKILGTQKNYYIAETEFGDDDYEEDVSDNEADPDDLLSSGLRDEDSSLFDDIILPEDLKPMYKPPPKIPCEPAGTGMNRKVYFVASDPGMPWVRLPHATPAQIQAARKIRKLFTGDLDAQVISFPPFPGVEKNYLRTQIARISASTHISPIGFFRFDDEGDEEEETAEESGGGRASIIQDVEFEGLAIRDLADGSLQAWVHHAQAILPQGRTTWWNPVETKEAFNEEEEEDEEEERNEPDEPEPEVGPPLLTPLVEDENIGISPAWIAATSSKFVPEHAIAVVQSNVWVGAIAFAADKGKFHENVYVGWGLKNLGHDYEPALPEMPMIEFPSGPEITELDDPTPEEEAAVRAALQEKELEAEFEQNINEDDDDDDIVDEDVDGAD